MENKVNQIILNLFNKKFWEIKRQKQQGKMRHKIQEIILFKIIKIILSKVKKKKQFNKNKV
jgi:dsRNA-specific ribonuclease